MIPVNDVTIDGVKMSGKHTKATQSNDLIRMISEGDPIITTTIRAKFLENAITGNNTETIMARIGPGGALMRIDIGHISMYTMLMGDEAETASHKYALV